MSMKLKIQKAIKLCDIPDKKVARALYKVRENIIWDESDEERRFFNSEDVSKFIDDLDTEYQDGAYEPREAARLLKAAQLGYEFLTANNIDVVLLEPTYYYAKKSSPKKS